MSSVTARAKEGPEVSGIGSAIQIDPEKVGAHVDEVVRGTVEQTLNALLDSVAQDELNLPL